MGFLLVKILFADETLKRTLNNNENKRKLVSVSVAFERINYYASIYCVSLLNTLCSRYYASYRLSEYYILYQILYFIFIIK